MALRYSAQAWLATWLVGGLWAALVADGSHALPLALAKPSLAHPFGFDAFGRDLLETVLRASLLSSGFAAGSVLVSLVVAILAGAGTALAPAPARFVLLRALEALLAFPSLLFALGWAALRGPGWGTLVFSLLIGTLPSLTRLVFARTRELLAEDYVLAARSYGASTPLILRRHLAPALWSLCRVKLPNLFVYALMAEATLSFLGIGAPLGRDSWGSLLAQGKDYLFESPHIALSTGIPLVLTVLSLQNHKGLR
ncbi:MAG: ABC transporter permease subunit [Oligoflexia bacterium]|nr:ABC transporter permease subunit [Oligoflexia bacterium]